MPDAMNIIREVADRYGVSVEMMRGKKHPRMLFEARANIYARLREERSLSYPQIGRLMGMRDHTTIIHAVSEERRARDIALIYGHKEKTKCRRGGFQQRLRAASSRSAREQRKKEEAKSNGLPDPRVNRRKPPASETRPTSS